MHLPEPDQVPAPPQFNLQWYATLSLHLSVNWFCAEGNGVGALIYLECIYCLKPPFHPWYCQYTEYSIVLVRGLQVPSTRGTIRPINSSTVPLTCEKTAGGRKRDKKWRSGVRMRKPYARQSQSLVHAKNTVKITKFKHGHKSGNIFLTYTYG